MAPVVSAEKKALLTKAPPLIIRESYMVVLASAQSYVIFHPRCRPGGKPEVMQQATPPFYSLKLF